MTQGAFLYFVPGKTANDITPEWLKGSPLSNVLRDCWERRSGMSRLERLECHAGPDGGRGVILTAAAPQSQAMGYKPALQTWANVGPYWLGFQNDMRPGPESLARPRIIEGPERELADGNIWVLPIVAQPKAETITPWTVSLPNVVSSTGKWTLAERYQAVWDATAKIINYLLLGTPVAEDAAKSFGFLYQTAAMILGLNYRVGPHELDTLQLLEDDDHAAILRAACDMDTVDAIVAAKSSPVPANPTPSGGSPSS